MLDFLENDNPLIRHSSKSWLTDSIQLFYRILDPIFEVLLQSSTPWYVTENRQFFYLQEYETQNILEAFRKLKSILITATEQFIRYISQIRISEKIKEVKTHFAEDPSTGVSQLIEYHLIHFLEFRN